MILVDFSGNYFYVVRDEVPVYHCNHLLLCIIFAFHQMTWLTILACHAVTILACHHNIGMPYRVTIHNAFMLIFQRSSLLNTFLMDGLVTGHYQNHKCVLSLT